MPGPPHLGGFGVLRGQHPQGVRWTPSRMIARLGKEINNPESVCYWAQKVKGGGKQGVAPPPRGIPAPAITASPPHTPKFQNKIPVLSPALTDGSLGDMIFFHSYKRPGLVLDIVEGEFVPGGGRVAAGTPPKNKKKAFGVP